MKINHVKINNILGIKELEFAAGNFTEISGRNGEGKTSVLEAIKAAIRPAGHDATLLRNGADKGEIVLVLDDNTEVRKRVTGGSSPLEVRGPDGSKVAKPADIMKQLSDMIAVNPIDFLRATKKDRTRVLLEAMPLTLDRDALAEAAGIPVPEADDDVHALAMIELLRKQVYDDRTGTNRAVKEKEVTINQLTVSLPDPVDGVEGSEEELRHQVQATNDTRDSELVRIATKLDGVRSDTQTKIDAAKDAAAAEVAELERQITAIRERLQGEIEGHKAEFTRIEGLANKQREVTIQRHADTTGPINEQLAVIVSNRNAVAKREQTVALIKQLESELSDLVEDADKQTKSIGRIDDYKKQLLAGLPIPGVEVVDGEIYRNGVIFDRLNTAQQVSIAVEIAKLRAGDLGVCCVDGLELLSTDAFEEFRERCLESNLQLFVTRVNDSEFTVTTE